MSSSNPLVPPRSYFLEWSGKGLGRKHADILLEANPSKGLQPVSSILSTTPTLVQEQSDDDAKSPFDKSLGDQSIMLKPEDRASTSNDPNIMEKTASVRGDRVYHIHHVKWNSKSYELFEVPADAKVVVKDADEAGLGRKLMDIQQEGLREAIFTYTDAANPDYSTVMTKFKGDGGEGFFSINRSFNDFDGVHYKFKTQLFGDLTIIRTADNVMVARFVHTKFSMHHIGKLTILIPTSPSLHHLLLCTTFMKFLQDRRRRQRATRAGGAGAAGS
ncbi:hypothetical protein FRB94_001690 [Tulasnella sp. JGI-2019a]|nr:hypothetical protein FRB94_001690 [Tulasnella sp. JGI-2019a]